MTIPQCIAHAIHSDLDIVECCPELHDMDIPKMEKYVEEYVLRVQRDFEESITEGILDDLPALTFSVEMRAPYLPKATIRKMCRTIMELRSLDARFIGEWNGRSFYFMRMNLS